jgi:hypothetical protein
MMKCESCGMPIESGVYCEHCSDENGALQSLDERIRRMSIFMKDQDSSLDDVAADIKVREYLKNMPAWKNHPDF